MYSFRAFLSKQVSFSSVLYLKRKIDHMERIEITLKGVEQLPVGLNLTTAMDPDELHPSVLKDIAILPSDW